MKIKKNVSMNIERSYKITSKELKEALEIEGEIIDMSLFSGRSPNDIAQGISPDDDLWEIRTKENKEVKNKRFK